MFSKNIIFLTIFSFTTTLIGMQQNNNWKLDKIIEVNNWTSTLCINPTEEQLIVVPCAQHIYTMDLKTNKKTAYLDINNKITSILFDQSGEKIAALSHAPETSIFNISQNKNKLIYKKRDSFQHKGSISSLYFDKDNNLLGIQSTDDYQLHITNLKTNEKITSFNHNS